MMLTAAFAVAGQTGASPGVDVDGPYGGPDTYEALDMITFTATTDDPSLIFFRWDFNNDSIMDTAWRFSMSMSDAIGHVYCDDYHDVVYVEAWDGRSLNPENDTARVDVYNVPPNAFLPGPYVGYVGKPIRFRALGSDAGCDDLTFIWDWGDDTGDVQTYYFDRYPNAVWDRRLHTYYAPGTYNVALLVMDDDGGLARASTRVFVRASLDGIDDLIDYTTGLPIPGGTKRSLTAQLITAKKALLRDHENSAVRMLNVFIHRVQVLERAGKLREEQAEHMITSAQEITRVIRGT